MTDLPPYPVPRTEAGRRLLALDEFEWASIDPTDVARAILAIEAEARADLATRTIAAVGGLRVGPGKNPNIARLAHDEAIDAALATIRTEAER